MSRRNSPMLHMLGEHARQQVARTRRPALPQQAEMPGMETNDAAKVLMDERRRVQAKRDKKAGEMSKEDKFDLQIRQLELPTYVRQYMFAKQEMGRRWQFDFAWLKYMLAVEVEGLVVNRVTIAVKDEFGRITGHEDELIVRGRHASIAGFKEDCIKYAAAAELGWTVLRFEQSQVADRTAIASTQRILMKRGWQP